MGEEGVGEEQPEGAGAGVGGYVDCRGECSTSHVSSWAELMSPLLQPECISVCVCERACVSIVFCGVIVRNVHHSHIDSLERFVCSPTTLVFTDQLAHLKGSCLPGTESLVHMSSAYTIRSILTSRTRPCSLRMRCSDSAGFL